MSAAEKITDHDKIREWAESRGGRPSVVKATHGEESPTHKAAKHGKKGKGKHAHRGGGILRFDFQEPDAGLEEIDWDEFFEIFEDNKLALLEQEQTASGAESRFFKFVAR